MKTFAFLLFVVAYVDSGKLYHFFIYIPFAFHHVKTQKMKLEK